jgi:DNA-binding MarR family transcriptional regulator
MDPQGVATGFRHLGDIAEELPQRVSCLTRLFRARTDLPVSRTEMAVLRAALTRPRRITELAAGEGVTQPAITRVVNHLVENGWVERRPDPDDGRAVVVAITTAGHALYETVRAEYRALLHEEMAALSDDDIQTLDRAIDVLDELIGRLQDQGR